MEFLFERTNPSKAFKVSNDSPTMRNPQCAGTGRFGACDQDWTSLTQFSTELLCFIYLTVTQIRPESYSLSYIGIDNGFHSKSKQHRLVLKIALTSPSLLPVRLFSHFWITVSQTTWWWGKNLGQLPKKHVCYLKASLIVKWCYKR